MATGYIFTKTGNSSTKVVHVTNDVVDLGRTKIFKGPVLIEDNDPSLISIKEGGGNAMSLNISAIITIDGSAPAGTMQGVIDQLDAVFPEASTSGSGGGGPYTELTASTYTGGNKFKNISGSSASTITVDATSGGVLLIYNSGSATSINFHNTSSGTQSFTINASGTNGGLTGFGIIIANGDYNITPDVNMKFLAIPSGTNAAPVASSLSITGTQTVGQTLTGHYTYADADSDTESGTTFKWYRADDGSGTNRAAISGATSSTYVLQNADEAKYIQFGVTPGASAGTSPGSEALSSYTGAIAAGSTTDTDAQAFIDAVTLAGGTFSAGLQTKLHSFYIAAKGNGYYTKLKAAYFPLSANANGNKVNMITPGTRDLTYGGSAISHASDGMDFNTSGYADTGFDPSVLLTANNTHLSYYSTENTSGAYVEMGVNTAAYAIRFDLLVSLSGDAYSMMNSSGTWATVANANSSGFYVGSRTSSTVHKLYKNGTEIASTATAESAALPNGPVFLGAWNLLGTGAQNNTDRKMAFASIGQGLSPTEAGNFSTDLAALLAP